MNSQPLILITDDGRLRKEQRLIHAVSEALAGAAGKVYAVLLRELSASDEEIIQLGKELKPICTRHGAKLIVSRRVDLVEAIGAAGVHLGKHTVSISAARKELGSGKTIGYSAHSLEEVKDAAEADYIFLSPVFSPLSKTDARQTLGISVLKTAAQISTVPLFALGGITVENASECIKAGASGVAMISSILLATNPRVAAGKILT